jgi:2-polyprenyl-3-methyl-5-hydroxy-6-metoxy-1,4-benzoquinol methylase
MQKGTRAEAQVHIDAVPDVVYGVVSDVTRMGEWSPETTRCVWLDGATGPTVGARFKGTNKRGFVSWSTKPRVVAAEPGREFTFDVGTDTRWTYRFDEDGSGTNLTESFEMLRDLRWYYAFAERWIMRIEDRRADLERGMVATLERIKAVVESETYDGQPRDAQAAEWDGRYTEREGSMWSGRPNGRLVQEIADVASGRALDVGCGEGADAIWLSRRGWEVTAIDISDVAVGRARDAADDAGVSVEWVCADVLQMPLPAGSFDLVSMQYPALPKSAGEAAVRSLLDTVCAGGLLLAVYHDLDDEHREHMKSRGIDPSDYVGADDLLRLLGDDFTIELHAIEPRRDPPPGTPHIADVVIRARRR